MDERTPFGDVCTELLREGRAVRFRASGWSMEPAIRDGDVITVEPAGPEAVDVGDVLLYLDERGPTAHRLIARIPGSPAAFRVRADAVGAEEETVPAARLVGKVSRVEERARKPFVVRALGRASRLFRTAAQRTFSPGLS